MKTSGIRAFSDLAQHILSIEAPPDGTTRVVAVDGPSGSGKTTFAARLTLHLSCPTVHMDDLYPGWDGLADSTRCLEDWILTPLAQDRPARYRRFDWEANAYAGWHEVPTSKVLVVEGVGSGASAEHLSFLVWVEAPKPLRMKRGIERDGEVFRPHWKRWAAQEEAMFHASRTRERADLLVSGVDEDPKAPHDPEREFILLPA